MTRKISLSWSLRTKHKVVVIAGAVGAGFGLGFGVAHLLGGTIAYWGVVSGPFLLTLRVALPATVIAGVAGIASGCMVSAARDRESWARHGRGVVGGMPEVVDQNLDIGHFIKDQIRIRWLDRPRAFPTERCEGSIQHQILHRSFAGASFYWNAQISETGKQNLFSGLGRPGAISYSWNDTITVDSASGGVGPSPPRRTTASGFVHRPI